MSERLSDKLAKLAEAIEQRIAVNEPLSIAELETVADILLSLLPTVCQWENRIVPLTLRVIRGGKPDSPPRWPPPPPEPKGAA